MVKISKRNAPVQRPGLAGVIGNKNNNRNDKVSRWAIARIAKGFRQVRSKP